MWREMWCDVARDVVPCGARCGAMWREMWCHVAPCGSRCEGAPSKGTARSSSRFTQACRSFLGLRNWGLLGGETARRQDGWVLPDSSSTITWHMLQLEDIDTAAGRCHGAGARRLRLRILLTHALQSMGLARCDQGSRRPVALPLALRRATSGLVTAAAPAVIRAPAPPAMVGRPARMRRPPAPSAVVRRPDIGCRAHLEIALEDAPG